MEEELAYWKMLAIALLAAADKHELFLHDTAMEVLRENKDHVILVVDNYEDGTMFRTAKV